MGSMNYNNLKDNNLSANDTDTKVIAYARDERREAFTPVIYSGRNGMRYLFKSDHCGVGGSWRERGYANHSLTYMIGAGRNAGAPFGYPKLSDYQTTNEEIIHGVEKAIDFKHTDSFDITYPKAPRVFPNEIQYYNMDIRHNY